MLPMKTTIVTSEITGSDGEVVRQETLDVELIGRKVHLLRGLNAKRVVDEHGVGYMKDGIYITEEAADRNENPTDPMWFEILAVSDDCKYFKPEHVGGWVLTSDQAGCSYPVRDNRTHREIICKERMWDTKLGGAPLMVVMP